MIFECEACDEGSSDEAYKRCCAVELAPCPAPEEVTPCPLAVGSLKSDRNEPCLLELACACEWLCP